MLGTRIISHIKEEMPELKDLQVMIGGSKLNVGDYELLNAFLIHNNVLDDTKKSLAIFHPKNDLLDVWLLITMGLSAYKYSVLKNSKLLISDFKKGELVEYNGRILLYNGVYVDPVDKIERFQLVYGDEYTICPTSENIPVRYFPELSKYTGSKTTPDLSSAKRHKRNVKDALQTLLNLQEQYAGFSGYPTFLISSESSRFADLLREVQVNGTPFFDMFPSAKCTQENRQRLGRDSIKRSFMFYFVTNLSTADDVLRDEPHIRTLFVDARGKSLKDGTLLASVRTQYGLEDIYMLQTLDRLDSANKLDSGLGFKIWIWDKSDFSGMESQNTNGEQTVPADNDFVRMVADHNAIPGRLSNYIDTPVEVAYPPGLALGQHDSIQTCIREMFSLSRDYGNADMQNFSIHAAGVANRIFQSPVPAIDADNAMKDSGRRTFNEDIVFLKERLNLLSYGPIPEDFKFYASELISLLEQSTNAFKDYYGKRDAVVSIIKNNPDIKICILVNSKYASMSEAAGRKIAEALNSGGNGLPPGIVVADNLAQSATEYDIIIWTYKPPYGEYLMLEPSVQNNFILLYPLQKKEYELSTVVNSRRFMPYLKSDYRSGVMKVPAGMLQEKTPPPGKTTNELDAFDLEQLLSATMAKAVAYYHGSGHANLVEARMVLFTDGTHALFQPGNKIKVVDLEHEAVETKTVNSLSEDDDVAFLKDSKRTVFDELVEYYQHKPEVVELIKISELWRSALIVYRDEHFLHPVRLKKILDEAGLVRHPATIESWLDGSTICPVEDDYAGVDIIARVTNDTNLDKDAEDVKNAARKIHALRIKIGRYLAKRITQSYFSPDSIIDDPVLRDKLDEISSHVRIVRVYKITDEPIKVPAEMTNKLLTEEDM